MALQLVLYFIRVRCVRLPASCLYSSPMAARDRMTLCSVSACWGVVGWDVLCCVCFCCCWGSLSSRRLLLLVAVAADVARSVAQVARLRRLGAVARQMAHLVAVEACLIGHAVHLPALGAAARDVPRLVAVVARRRVRVLVAVLGEVTLAVAAVAALRILLAFARKVTQSVALVALLAPASVAVAAGVASATSTAAATTTGLRTLPGEVPWAAALVAHARTHLDSGSLLFNSETHETPLTTQTGLHFR